MALSEKDITALKKIKDFEDSTPEKDWELGWSWSQAGISTATINKLITEDCVTITYSSARFKHYKLTEKGRLTVDELEKLAATESLEQQVTSAGLGYPPIAIEDIFSEIVGYDDLKELLREALQTEKTLHVLLYGPPSIAKTLFLSDIERACGQSSMWLIGSATSRAGLWDIVAEKRPKYLLVDELEKMTLVDMTGLLSLMEKGRLVRTKVGRRLDEKLDVWVIAAANRINRIPAELLSRFAKYSLTEYNATDYVKVVKSVLVKLEDLDEDSAAQVAIRLVGKTHDVRDAIRVARLSKRVGVTRAVELLIR